MMLDPNDQQAPSRRKTSATFGRPKLGHLILLLIALDAFLWATPRISPENAKWVLLQSATAMFALLLAFVLFRTAWSKSELKWRRLVLILSGVHVFTYAASFAVFSSFLANVSPPFTGRIVAYQLFWSYVFP